MQRTISWQKLLHVKPAEVVFEMAAMAWSPDGLRLAVGCDDGELVVFQVETGERLLELRGLRKMTDALAHGGAVTAMHWVGISGGNARARTNDAVAQPSALFQDRAARFLGAGGASSDKTALDSVLVTADADGRVGLWWSGKVLLASVDVASHLSETERALVASGPESQQRPPGCGASATRAGFRIEQVHLSPDLARLFVWVRFEGSSSQGAAKPEATSTTTSGEHRMVALALPSLQRVSRDACFLARTMDSCSTILDGMLLAAKQMTAEVGTKRALLLSR